MNIHETPEYLALFEKMQEWQRRALKAEAVLDDIGFKAETERKMREEL